MEDWFATGFVPGCGTYYCLGCGDQLTLREPESLPECPGCGGRRFRRDSIFLARQDHGWPTDEIELPGRRQAPDWLEEARASLAAPGHHLAMSEEGTIETFAIERSWTRIGRSATADLCLDDPTVSRRHAIIVDRPDKPLRVLDDRSLNGVFVNGREVEWGPLGDGDELAIGRFRLFALRCR